VGWQHQGRVEVHLAVAKTGGLKRDCVDKSGLAGFRVHDPIGQAMPAPQCKLGFEFFVQGFPAFQPLLTAN